MNDLRPAMISARPPEEQVERREVLEHADRVVRAQDGDRAREPDPARSLRPRGEHHRGRRHSEVGPMVLAHAEDVEADPIGELDLLEQVAEALGSRGRAPRRRIGRQLRERVDAELEWFCLHTQAKP